MKLKIKIKRLDKTVQLPSIIDKGEWVDLRSAESIKFKAPQAGVLRKHIIEGKEVSSRDVTFDTRAIKLGVAMKLPKGFEAIIVPRSSLPKLGVFQTNSIGVVDNSYSGNQDEWKYWITALENTIINKGDRICQFRIQLSQKATMWQKIKWILSSGIKIVEVADLSENNRGGIGSTGIK